MGIKTREERSDRIKMEKSEIEVITKEVDIFAFQSGIFFSKANLLSPVAVYPETGFQSLETFLDGQKEYSQQWVSYAGPAGIGQYSLKHGPANIVARFNTHFRHPTKEEMSWDFEHYGEQVLGPIVNEVPKDEVEKYKGNTRIRVFGEDFYFTGPPRMIKSVFLTRVFPGEMPEDISRFIKEVDEASEIGEMIVSQGYQFFHAEKGRMLYLPFGKVEEFDSSKASLFGTVEIEDRIMTYYPMGDKSHPVDFTEAIINEK